MDHPVIYLRTSMNSNENADDASFKIDPVGAISAT